MPCAIASVVGGLTLEQARMLIEIWLAQWDFSGQAVKDKTELLETIMGSMVKLDRGVQRPVSQLLAEVKMSPDAQEIRSALASCGLKIVTKDDDSEFLFIHPNSVQRHLLRDSQFSGHVISDYLLRLPGAERDLQRLAGRHYKGISIPLLEMKASIPDNEEPGHDDGSSNGEF